MKRYCVLGSVNVDLVTRVRRFPDPGETVDGISFSTFPGGKGANQAVALGRLGVAVEMVGRIGDDSFGSSYRQMFAAAGVDDSAVETMRGCSTGTASIEVSGTGENRIIIVPGANGLVDIDFVERNRSAIEKSDFLLLQLEVPLEAVVRAARIARDCGTIVILDPAPARQLQRDVLSLVDYVTPNETEAKILTGINSEDESGARRAGERLRESGAATAIIKVGRRGAYIVADGRFEHTPAFAVNVVDTTAAGDSFNAGLAFALGSGLGISAAVRVANAVAALSTTREGAQAAMPTRPELDSFLEKPTLDDRSSLKK